MTPGWIQIRRRRELEDHHAVGLGPGVKRGGVMRRHDRTSILAGQQFAQEDGLGRSPDLIVLFLQRIDGGGVREALEGATKVSNSHRGRRNKARFCGLSTYPTIVPADPMPADAERGHAKVQPGNPDT